MSGAVATLPLGEARIQKSSRRCTLPGHGEGNPFQQGSTSSNAGQQPLVCGSRKLNASSLPSSACVFPRCISPGTAAVAALFTVDTTGSRRDVSSGLSTQRSRMRTRCNPKRYYDATCLGVTLKCIGGPRCLERTCDGKSSTLFAVFRPLPGKRDRF